MSSNNEVVIDIIESGTQACDESQKHANAAHIEGQDGDPDKYSMQYNIIIDAKAFMAAEEDSKDCCICLDPLKGESALKCTSFTCGHELHIPCALEYVKDKLKKNEDLTCPVCRHNQCMNNTNVYADLRKHFGIPSARNRGVYTVLSLNTERLPSQRPTRARGTRYPTNQAIYAERQAQTDIVPEGNAPLGRFSAMLFAVFCAPVLIFGAILILTAIQQKSHG